MYLKGAAAALPFVDVITTELKENLHKWLES